MPKTYHIMLEHPQKGRMDQVLWRAFQEVCPDLSRTRFQACMQSGALSRGGVPILKNQSTTPAGAYCLSIDDPVPSHIEPVFMPLNIVYEDEDVVVLNKPAGLTVHPGAGTHAPTLVHGLLYHFKGKLSGIGGVERPGIVHRLDKDTSGLMVVAKNDHAHQHLSKQFETRSLTRTYYAYVWGRPHPLAGCIHTLIGRHPIDRQKMKAFSYDTTRGVTLSKKEAITHYKALKFFEISSTLSYTKVACTLKTGRTHQIRVHMLHIGCPIIADPVYGKVRVSKYAPQAFTQLQRQALHAARMSFIHPCREETMHFECELPEDLLFLEGPLEG